MNVEAISNSLSRLSFREAVWFFPIAFTLHISKLAYREGLLTTTTGLSALLLAGVFHIVEVGHNVFKAW